MVFPILLALRLMGSWCGQRAQVPVVPLFGEVGTSQRGLCGTDHGVGAASWSLCSPQLFIPYERAFRVSMIMEDFDHQLRRARVCPCSRNCCGSNYNANSDSVSVLVSGTAISTVSVLVSGTAITTVSVLFPCWSQESLPGTDLKYIPS